MNKKFIYKILSYLIVLIIFFFLGKTFFENWQKIKDYDFSFNYFYLILSYLFLFLGIFLGVFIWNKVLRILEPDKKLSFFKAFKVYIYSWFGRYLPGKVWMFAGRVYLGQKEGIPKKPLLISVIYEIILSIASGFLLSLFLLSIAFGSKLYGLYLIPIFVVLGGLFFSHPKVIFLLFNIILKKFKKINIKKNDFLNYKTVIQIILYYFVSYLIEGIAFFFLINSIISLSFYDIIGVIGAYTVALVSGTVAIFAPGGLGVREGILVLILQFYFSISIVILISVVARIWFTLAELILWSSSYLCSKLKRKSCETKN